MVHFVRIVLATSIVAFAVNNAIVDAGNGKISRKKNLENRASEHVEKLKPHAEELKSKYGDMTKADIKELKNLNNVIIDHIMKHDEFNNYLRNVDEALQKYADGLIKEEYDSLETVYKKWENENFPNKELKEQVKNTLTNKGKLKRKLKRVFEK